MQRARLTAHTLEARLVDFSRSGIGLETHVALRIGATYRFRLFSGRGRTLTATVRWCRLRATRRGRAGEVLPVFRAGLLVHARGGNAGAGPSTWANGDRAQPPEGRTGPER